MMENGENDISYQTRMILIPSWLESIADPRVGRCGCVVASGDERLNGSDANRFRILLPVFCFRLSLTFSKYIYIHCEHVTE